MSTYDIRSKNKSSTLRNSGSFSDKKKNSETITNQKEPVLNDNFFNHMKIFCKKHGAEIGGICQNYSCTSPIQLKCIKCLADKKMCIKQNGHTYVNLDGFYEQFLNIDYNELRNSYKSSKMMKLAENYCKNSDVILDDFKKKASFIVSKFEAVFNDVLENLKIIKQQFIEQYQLFMNEKYSDLKNELIKLERVLNYDTCEGFDYHLLKYKIIRLSYDSLNELFLTLKKTYLDLKHNKHVPICDAINDLQIDNKSSDNICEFINKKLREDIEEPFKTTIQVIESEIKSKIFFKEKEELKPLSCLKKYYQEPLDYSLNNFFADKGFVVYKNHKLSSENSPQYFLAYPNSLNMIKIERFTEQISSIKELDNKPKMILTSDLKARESLLYFRLKGHIAKITILKYFFHPQKEEDFLISSGFDKTIRIWRLTDIENYISENEIEQSKLWDTFSNECEGNVMKLVGHKNTIEQVEIYCNSSKYGNYTNNTNNTNECENHKKNNIFIISLAKGDKIKVWDFDSGELIKEIYDRNSEFRGSYEDLFILSIQPMAFSIDNKDKEIEENKFKKNKDKEKNVKIIYKKLLVTINNTNKIIKVWDFENGNVIEVLDYIESNLENRKNIGNTEIVRLINYEKQNKILLIDKSGESSILEFIIGDGNSIYSHIMSLQLNTGNSERVNAFFWDSNTVIFHTKNGRLIQYSLETNQVLDRIIVSDKEIHYALKFDDEINERKLIVCYSMNKFLYIFG